MHGSNLLLPSGLARASLELNRYPDGGAWRLRNALAERHGVRFEQVTVCAGADAVVGYVCQATLDPGDEVVIPAPCWVSYPEMVQMADGVLHVEAPRKRLFTTTLYLFVVWLVGSALMGLVFLSNGTGHDDSIVDHFADDH